jgi:hypothetical protein
MAKKRRGSKSKRRQRPDPARTGPIRSGTAHVRRHAKPPNDTVGAGAREQPPDSIVDTVKQTIEGVVDLGYTVIEQQIREGQQAADRLRAGLATSPQLNTDVNNLVEGLVATTRDVGATWLDVISIVLRSVGPQTPCPTPPRGFAAAGQPGMTRARTGTTTRTSTSGSATTISSITPADAAAPAVPPVILVTGIRVRRVTLDLRPPSIQFVPFVRSLAASDPRHAPLTGVRFELSADQTHSVLSVNVPRNQPAGTYTGVIVDSTTNEPGGTVSVTVGN